MVVIGAGIGGLSTAAILARSGLEVTVLEAHIYPGGCAGTFTYQGYRFDAGATLAGGFYPNGPMDLLAQQAGVRHWSGRPADPVMRVHLPNRQHITRWSNDRRWEAYRTAFGKEALSFWYWQEKTAEVLWDLALRLPPWPPQNLSDMKILIHQGMSWLEASGLKRIMEAPSLLKDAFGPVAAHLDGLPESLRLFVDAQLLISAQTDSQEANALYGAAALDLPRRGVVNLEGGMGTIARWLAQAVSENHGSVLYRQEVKRIRFERGRPVGVETQRGDVFDADLIVANLTPWDLADLIDDEATTAARRLRRLKGRPTKTWGAFTLYLGAADSVIPPNSPLHHQMVLGRPLGEGNSLFLSISPEWDDTRAPDGKRALTLSTHTDLNSWWDLLESDQAAYQALRTQYTSRLLATAEQVFPGLIEAAGLVLPGTPVTFQRFTHRAKGWVGGFPQTDLWQARGPRLGSNLWMVGDSIYPGQSVAATAMGGLRVAKTILEEQNAPKSERDNNWRLAT